ncbi:MAG: EAL domain-containing protein [Lysobacter sp.]|nr:EAL domain-containing protein [Lysobacter sp.]
MGAPAAAASSERLLLDSSGRIHDSGGVQGSITDLFPTLDPGAFSALCAAADAAPACMLRLDIETPEGAVVVLALSRESSAPARYLVALDRSDGSASYRQRLDQRLAFERLIAGLSVELIDAPADRLDELIKHALGGIGRLFAVDRAYLFRFSADRSSYSNTHEWVEEGISREAEHLQDVPIGHFPWLLEEFVAGRAVHVPVVSLLPDSAATEREEFMREGIRSIALVPFGEVGTPEGFIGFDSVRRQRHWPQEILLGLRLVGQMFSNAFSSREMSERLTRLAFHDALTGMGNRRFLGERLSQALERSRRHGGQLAVILIDLDDFKLVNDSFGHSLGDEILKTAASRLSGTVRGGDIVARLGGDEFVVIAEVDGLVPLSQLLERLFDAMLAPVELRGVSFALRMSVGIALHPDDGSDAEALLRQADTAMYAAKAEGKNRFAFFTPRMTRDSRAALRLRHELRLAIERDEIGPHYQPRVALPSMQVVGFEALARWCHPTRGLLQPAQFLGLAQSSGQIGRIDMCMLQRALADVALWRKTDPLCMVSVNLDAVALQDEHLLAQLREILAGASDGGEGLEIEITESSLMRDIGRAATALASLRRAAPGLRVSIDDFGSGYSSLAYLGRLPVTALKIDRSFIAELATEDRRSARAIIHSIIDLGRSLGLHVIAEGVETSQQAAELSELGCTEAQGYLFSHPVPVAEATALLKKSGQAG